MKENNKNSFVWRRLDNSAKIYPLSRGKKYSPVFRLSAVLKEDINPDVLRQALIETLEKYKVFKVRLKKGFFWHYLEENKKEPIVLEESDYPCKYVDPNLNRGYLFRVTYFKNKINIDIFHALTDGNSGNVFFRELIYTYLEKIYPNDLNPENRISKKPEYDTEDSYKKNYNKKHKFKVKDKRAYKIRGKKIKLGAVSVNHLIINLDQLKEEAKKYNVTITQYLTAVLLYCIYKENYINNKDKRPVKICIPVNLKKYFTSKTMTNFFSYIILSADFQRTDITEFEKLLNFVKTEFENKLTEEEVLKIMSDNVKFGNNFFVKIVPLFLKIIIVRLAYMEIRKHFSITFSNIGRIGILGDYKKYIDYFLMLIAPEQYERIKCTGCTFENKLVFSFSSIINDNKIQKGFYKFLTEKGIEINVESNGVLDDIS